jgi:hypothetical protein
MATWQCPNCRTVQSDSAECFLCRRSATSCGTCAHFRTSFINGLGYCAARRDREPLRGDERRMCWTADAGPLTEDVFTLPGAAATTRGLLLLTPAPSVRPRELSER